MTLCLLIFSFLSFVVLMRVVVSQLSKVDHGRMSDGAFDWRLIHLDGCRLTRWKELSMTIAAKIPWEIWFEALNIRRTFTSEILTSPTGSSGRL